MKKYVFAAAFLAFAISGHSQKYEFQTIVDIECQPVISQGQTGTCWSFSSTSFLESEILRTTGKKIDLSEMYNVRHTYPKKAYNYIMRQGNAQFGEGGLNHDVLFSASEFGIVPVSAFPGLSEGQKAHNHSEMVKELEILVKENAKKPSADWQNKVDAILNKHLGPDMAEFTYEGKKYTPKSFLAMTKLKMEDYVTITSFTQVPFNSDFVLDIPDNFSNGRMYNLPLDEFIANIDNALDKGYTLALDADVSEKTFSSKFGVAVVPESDADLKAILTEIRAEKQVSQQFRQSEFENFNTTDDHLMHIVGKVKDQKGTVYYKVKNSWGSEAAHIGNGGFIYMSVPYMRLKAISVMVHKKALLSKTRKGLDI